MEVGPDQVQVEEDDFFRNDHDSPIDRGGFAGLKYFGPDPALRLETELHRIPVLKSKVMTTSKGTRQLFNEIGYFEISIEGKSVRLSAYQSAEREDSSIFIPFRDATSGKEG